MLASIGDPSRWEARFRPAPKARRRWVGIQSRRRAKRVGHAGAGTFIAFGISATTALEIPQQMAFHRPAVTISETLPDEQERACKLNGRSDGPPREAGQTLRRRAFFTQPMHIIAHTLANR